MSSCTNANSAEMMIVIAATTTIMLALRSGIEKPSQNTG